MNKIKPILEIKNLNASINDIQILNNFNLKINKGEIHAIMGRNVTENRLEHLEILLHFLVILEKTLEQQAKLE